MMSVQSIPLRFAAIVRSQLRQSIPHTPREPQTSCSRLHRLRWFTTSRRLARVRPEDLMNDIAAKEKSYEELDGDIEAESDWRPAPEINFETFKPGSASNDKSVITGGLDDVVADADRQDEDRLGSVLSIVRAVPASSAYFSAKPRFTESLLHISHLCQKYQTLPRLQQGEQPRVTWQEFRTYKDGTGEPVRESKFRMLIDGLRRLNMIHPALMPAEVTEVIGEWSTTIQPHSNKARPIELDEFGRAAATGRRKASSAKAWVVEGDGAVMVNGKPLHEVFMRMHDRESVIWAMKVTDRVDKYNVFALVRGGGTTGQAEALTLAVSKALVAHEPGLKTSLRKAGTITRDRRVVERKKHGHLKARKKPAWVRR